MQVTERAKQRLEWIQENYAQNVRLAVRGGGCAGFSYAFEFDLGIVADEDVVVETIVVDPASFDILRNAIVDFVADFNGNYFKVEVPEARSSCGCGKSFSI